MPTPQSPPPRTDVSEARTALRDRIAEALYRWTTEQTAGGPARLLTRDETVLWENSLARADAVLPVVEGETAALWDQIHRDQHDAMAATQRAVEAEDRLRKATDAYTRLHAEATEAEATRDRWRKRAEGAEAEIARLRALLAHLEEATGKSLNIESAMVAEQTQRAEKAEAAVQRVRGLAESLMAPGAPFFLPEAGHRILAALDAQEGS
jgi:chromosome segregation ATPase